MKFHVKIIREVEFVLEITAASRDEVAAIVLRTAYDCDATDQKETKIVSITEQKNIYDPFD